MLRVLEVHGKLGKMSTKHFLWKIFYVEKHLSKMVFKPLKYNSTEYIVLQYCVNCLVFLHYIVMNQT